MKYHYDSEHDVLAIDFRDAEYDESEEIYDGVIIDFDKSGRPMGIEIYQRASEIVDIPRLLRNFKGEEEREREPVFVRGGHLKKTK